MSKRFTETEKWSDPWFRKLKPNSKIGYLYLLDRVDNAGVIDLDSELANFQIGMAIDWESLREELADRVEVLASGKWHLTRFVPFQFGELNPECKPHAQVIRLSVFHEIKGYSKGIHTPQDKDKDKDKDKKKDKEPAELPEIPELINTPAMQQAWSDWLAFRKSIKKPVNSFGAKQSMKDFLLWGERDSIQSIHNSIRNGWQGLVAPKAGPSYQQPQQPVRVGL
jgi:hypothetical protein